jgi:CHAT domain-containing protein/Tfp pilus assembly protein PilF
MIVQSDQIAEHEVAGTSFPVKKKTSRRIKMINFKCVISLCVIQALLTWGLIVGNVEDISDQKMLADIAKGNLGRQLSQAAVKKLTDQKFLADVALNACYANIRQTAAEQLTDQEILAQIAKNDSDPNVREAAAKKLKSLSDKSVTEKSDSGADQEQSDTGQKPPLPDVHKAAVEKLNSQKFLAKVLMNNPDRKIRKSAVERLTDQNELADAAQNGSVSDVREAATKKLSDDSDSGIDKVVTEETDLSDNSNADQKQSDTGSNHPLSDVHKVAIEKLNSQKFLAKVLMNNPDQEIRKSAVERLTDQNGLADAAQNDSVAEIRVAAAERLDNPEILAEIARNDADPAVRKAASVRLARLSGEDAGLAYMNAGDYPRAAMYYNQLVKAARESQDRNGEMRCLDSLGLAYMNLGDYAKSIACYNEAIDIASRLGNTTAEGNLIGGLGLIYVNLGDYSKAIQSFKRAAETARKSKDRKSEGKHIGSLGLAYMKRGEYPQAIQSLEAAVKIAKETGDRNSEKIHIENLGLAYILEGNFYMARSVLDDADPLYKAMLNLHQNDLGGMVGFVRKLTEAIDTRISFGACIAYALASERDYESNASFRKTSFKRLAEHYFKKAIDKIEEERERLTEGQKTHFFGAVPFFNWNRLTPYEGLIRVSSDEEGFYYSEAVKARIFMEQTAGKYKKDMATEQSGIPLPLIEEEISIADDLASLYKQKDAAYKNKDDEALEKLDAEIIAEREMRDSFIARLREQYPEYAAVRYPQPLRVSETGLREGEVLIAYAVTETNTLAWLIRGTEIVKKIETDTSQSYLENVIYRYQEMISDPKNLTQAVFDPKPGHELYQLLVEELIAHVEEGEHIIIVPDKKLALVPFETMVISYPEPVSYNACPIGNAVFYTVPGITYLGDKYNISYYQSASTLTLLRGLKKEISRENKMLVVADPVFKLSDKRLKDSGQDKKQLARTEESLSLCNALEDQMGIRVSRLPLTSSLAKNLETLFGKNKAELMIGIRANETDFKNKDLTAYRYLVMATHGILGNIAGIMEPALILSQVGNAQDDGFLTMNEVTGLNFGADIAALTACETGRGKQLSGEGVMGLGRAFQYAGAKSVLVSLWSVAEVSSVELTQKFFSYIREGKNKADALSHARQDVRQAGYDHPFFWSPFVLHGEWQ